MKIGIVTQPLYNNYGGLLQNYALQQVLMRMGHEVKTIDFVCRQSFIRYFLSICKQLLVSVLKRKKHLVGEYVEFPMVRAENINSFVQRFIHTTRTVYKYTRKFVQEEKFDAVITGSDQVWRPMYNMYLEDMFLKFVPDKVCKIAYAASFGVDNWEYSASQTERCARYAKRLRKISVREKSGVDLCNNQLHVDATWVLDPTMLAERDVYKSLLLEDVGTNFLFAYILDATPEKLAFIKKIAQKKNLEVRVYSADQNAELSVEEWVSMIAYAELVVTDSFHGTVFSILFHREFLSIVNQERGVARLSSLLAPLGLLYRMSNITHQHAVPTDTIDWASVDEKLEEERKRSIDFLRTALG